jgi:hypothetical protein
LSRQRNRAEALRGVAAPGPRAAALAVSRVPRCKGQDGGGLRLTSRRDSRDLARIGSRGVASGRPQGRRCPHRYARRPEPAIHDHDASDFARLSEALQAAAPPPSETAEDIVGYLRAQLGANHAGISVIRRGSRRDTIAPTDPLVGELDRLQSELGEGRCFHACWPSQTLIASTPPRRWPLADVGRQGRRAGHCQRSGRRADDRRGSAYRLAQHLPDPPPDVRFVHETRHRPAGLGYPSVLPPVAGSHRLEPYR